MKITICDCQFYQRTPREKIAAVQAACLDAEREHCDPQEREHCDLQPVSCEIVPDLCYVAAKDRDMLESIVSCDFVLACQPRAVRALLSGLGNAKCIDLRTESLEEILAALSLPQDTPVIALRSIPAFAYNDADSIPASVSNDTAWKPWFPVIDAERCVHCRKCVDFCMFGVYAVEAEKVRVIKPESCKTDCPACARVCPQNAIMFPKSDDERLNGSLAEPVIIPIADDNVSFRERLIQRKGLRLFKEDTP